jgi:hypothetical protein
MGSAVRTEFTAKPTGTPDRSSPAESRDPSGPATDHRRTC